MSDGKRHYNCTVTKEQKEALRKKRLFLFDMDGTIYLDEELFDGTLQLLELIKERGGYARFLTNNSSRDVRGYIQKMGRMGIPTEKEDFITSVDAVVLYLKARGYQKIYAFGTAAFVSQLREAGLCAVTDREEGIDCLCVGFDTELTFRKLEDACILLGQEIAFVAANPDWVCPTWYGFVPDCGSVCAMLTRATGKTPRFIGKPQPEMVYLALESTGASANEALMIGDRLYTDIASGINAGIDTLLVLSGETKADEIEGSGFRPSFILQDVKQLYKILCES